ncbi:tripartite tricarboxylate transporter substrate binding protein [Kaustia mangrovi]|uniref:Tripartite tricarboxylate transporter substrate binding protein n=1 Tax=Kaustia mangrovi TaxID=2593653 RepID=A0A7S8C0X5_9HYPH|nr:tripartite tricarboxylate transporter substrate binding protein [Kaustia mangrovi]
MSEELGQTVVVENRPGAGGSIGTHEVVQAEPDGYTLSMGTVGTLAINKSIFPDLPYDPEKDVTPIAFAGYTPTLLVVRGDSDFKTLEDLVERSRAEGGDGVTFASAGNGTSGHLAGELVKVRSGGNMIHVPYRSAVDGVASVISGEVDFMFYHPISAKPYIESGELRALGVSGAKRSSVVPDAPPIDDSYPDFDLIAWFLLAGPAGMPKDVTEKLHNAVGVALKTEATRKVLERSGIEQDTISLSELPPFISGEVEKWGEIAKAASAQAN